MAGAAAAAAGARRAPLTHPAAVVRATAGSLQCLALLRRRFSNNSSTGFRRLELEECAEHYAERVADVRAETFESVVLASPVPVVVDFWAPWCKPCKAIEPHLRSLADAWDERARVVRVNVDEEPGIASRYGVLSLPTVILFVGGEPKATVYGAQLRARFEREFTPWV